jgi:two-component system chemotaxis response regulator CheB
VKPAERRAETALEDSPATRDMVLIGASAGGIEALSRLLSQLPGTFPAALFVVQHQSHDSSSRLVHVLQRASVLPVRWAAHQDAIVPGTVCVAPAGVHMAFKDEEVTLVPGPRENRARPSIDRLFRSAAVYHGRRAIGVILSGALDDGAAGLAALKSCGALTIVQHPEDATFPWMPQSALATVEPDRLLPLDRIGVALMELVDAPAQPVAVAPEVEVEVGIDESSDPDPAPLDRHWPVSGLACPDCGGPLWAMGPENGSRFRCYLGHAMTATSLLENQADNLERALWAAVRILQERASTLEALGRKAQYASMLGAHANFSSQSTEARENSDRLRRFLLELQRRRPLPSQE